MLKVLLVDDDINVLKCLKTLIPWHRLGYEVIGECFNGADAYALALKNNPDLIITDVKMPVMDGIEFCKKIRESLYGVYIIFLSGYQDFETAQIALKYNVNEYILKPINKQKIDNIVEILNNINQHSENQNYILAVLHDKDIEKEVINQLKNYNFSYFEDFFDNIIGWSVGNHALIKECCIKLVHILFFYLDDIGISPYRQSKEKAMKNLEQWKIKTDIITYVRELYFNVLQFENVKKDEYYEDLANNIKNYIDTEYSDPNFSLLFVADRYNFSVDYVSRIFQKYTGVTLGQYIIDIRIHKANQLMKETQLSVAEISVAVGYASPNYFTKMFKKKYNMTPTEYRRIIVCSLERIDGS